LLSWPLVWNHRLTYIGAELGLGGSWDKDLMKLTGSFKGREDQVVDSYSMEVWKTTERCGVDEGFVFSR